MMHCDECGVGFSGDLVRCPLCGTELHGAPSPTAFPVREIQRVSKLARRALAALAGLCLAATIVGGILLAASAWSIVALCAAIALAYLFVRNLLLHTPDSMRVTERYFLMLWGICALGFVATGNTAATTFVLPFISIAAILFNTVLLGIYRGAFVTGYAKYLLYNVVLGIAPLGFVATGFTDTPAPAIASAVASIVLAILLPIVARRQTAEEARKLFSA